MYKLDELSIELSNECGYSCIHCSSGATLYRLRDELTHTDHVRLVCEARALGATDLSLSGGNPMLYPGLVELVALAHNLGYTRIMIYAVPQNHWGRTIDKYLYIRELMSIPGVVWIFSLHSHQEHVNDHIMNVPGTLNDVKYSIRWLASRGIRTEVHMVPMQPNFMHIEGVRNLCSELGVKKMSCLRFVPQTRGKLNAAQLAMDKRDFYAMQEILYEQSLLEHSVDMRLGCPIGFGHAIGKLPAKAKLCHAGDDLMLVRPQGAVHPCAAWKSLPADANVKADSLEWIWTNSTVFQSIRRFKEEGYKELTGTCGKCTFIDSCMAGCPAQRLHAYGGDQIAGLYTDHSDPLCPKGDGAVKIDDDVKEAARNLSLLVANDDDCGCGCGG